MPTKRLIYFMTCVFIAGNIIFIFVKYNSDKNIRNLISGNQELLDEFKVNDEVKSIENAVAMVDNNVKSIVATGNRDFIDGMDKQIIAADMNLKNLQKISDDDSSEYFIDELDTLVRRRLRIDNGIITVYINRRKTPKNAIFKLPQYRTGADSIAFLAQKIVDTRQKILSRVTGTIDSSVNKVQRMNSFLIVFVLVSTAFLFIYIINTILTQNQLIQKVSLSEKKAIEAAMVKEHFLANMSHEIRTPMNAILGFTNLLANKDLGGESSRHIQIIQRSVENLLTIVNDILDISKIEAGMIRLECVPFNLRGLVNSVEQMFKIKAAEKQIRLVSETDDSLPTTLQGDAVRLTQILVNLISNAIKFTESGTIRIRVSNEGINEQMLELGIRVSDTGIGIEKAKLAHIFDRFQQVDDSVIREYGGTGLGLSIAKNLVELQQGSIDVTSDPGKGTTFHLKIPYKISTEEPSPVFHSESAETVTGHFGNVSILVVEDNEINQSLLRELFSAWHIQHDLAKNGVEAFEKIRTKTYDLVLMDIQMPIMDGYTATQQVRARLKSQVPIIAMTAHAMAGEKEKCLSYGMNEYISKPVRAAQLKLLIKQFIPEQLIGQRNSATQPAREPYQYIRLDYMREVAAGNIAYEKEVTTQFIDAVPRDLRALSQAAGNSEWNTLKKISHNLRTTVSVMGLNEMLQPFFDKIEGGSGRDELKQNIEAVKNICQKAVQEAKDFLQAMPA